MERSTGRTTAREPDKNVVPRVSLAKLDILAAGCSRVNRIVRLTTVYAVLKGMLVHRIQYVVERVASPVMPSAVPTITVPLERIAVVWDVIRLGLHAVLMRMGIAQVDGFAVATDGVLKMVDSVVRAVVLVLLDSVAPHSKASKSAVQMGSALINLLNRRLAAPFGPPSAPLQ